MSTVLLVGLGNPGPEYAATRHNLGAMLLDALTPGPWNKKFEGLTATLTIGTHKLILLKPQTYMNLSGRSVLAAATFYKLKPENILVAHDELDLPLGETRQKRGGGDAGHNGLKSITQAIGAEYHRLRLGIGRPERREQVEGYVLSPFSPAERPAVENLLNTLKTTLPEILAKRASAKA